MIELVKTPIIATSRGVYDSCGGNGYTVIIYGSHNYDHAAVIDSGTPTETYVRGNCSSKGIPVEVNNYRA